MACALVWWGTPSRDLWLVRGCSVVEAREDWTIGPVLVAEVFTRFLRSDVAVHNVQMVCCEHRRDGRVSGPERRGRARWREVQ
jgi:hypothetical protein